MARREDYPGKPGLGMNGLRRPQEPSFGAVIGRPRGELPPAEPLVASLPGEQPLAKPAGELIQDIEINAISPSPYQPRIVFDNGTIEELANSIALLGLVRPLLVRPLGAGKYELVGGERRWRAHQFLNRKTAQCVVREMDDKTAQMLALTDNEQESLSDFERGLGFWKLGESGEESSRRAIARRLGIPHTVVIRCMQFMSLPEWAIELLKEKPSTITLNYVNKFVRLCEEHEAICRPIIEQLFEGEIGQEKALRMIAQEIARRSKGDARTPQTYEIEGFGTVRTDGRKIELKCDSSVDMTEISKKILELLKTL